MFICTTKVYLKRTNTTNNYLLFTGQFLYIALI